MLLMVPSGRSFFGCGTGIEWGLLGWTKTWWLPLIRCSIQPAASSSAIKSLLFTC